jgi:hypothetical protein
MWGKEVTRQQVFGGLNILWLSQLPPGAYFYEVHDNAGILGRGKVVKAVD